MTNMDWRRDSDGSIRVFRDRHFWVDQSNQPIPDLVKPPAIVVSKDGMYFGFEEQDVLRMARLLEEAQNDVNWKRSGGEG